MENGMAYRMLGLLFLYNFVLLWTYNSLFFRGNGECFSGSKLFSDLDATHLIFVGLAVAVVLLLLLRKMFYMLKGTRRRRRRRRSMTGCSCRSRYLHFISYALLQSRPIRWRSRRGSVGSKKYRIWLCSNPTPNPVFQNWGLVSSSLSTTILKCNRGHEWHINMWTKVVCLNATL